GWGGGGWGGGGGICGGGWGGGVEDGMWVQVQKGLVRMSIKERPFNGIPAEVRKPTWVEPRLVCEVRFNEWTSDKKLRAPIFQGFRDDVDAKECLLEDALPKSSPGSRFELQASPSGRCRRKARA